MITRDKLKELVSFKADSLTRFIQERGYRGDKFDSAMFTGITNGGQFCYHCVYMEEGSKNTCKVFLTYNPMDGTVSAEY
jgi:hypothetical protein